MVTKLGALASVGEKCGQVQAMCVGGGQSSAADAKRTEQELKATGAHSWATLLYSNG